MRTLARCGHDHVITSGHCGLAWLPQMGANEPPLQQTLVHRSVEKALDRSITPPFASPAGQAQHGHPPRHRQHGLSDHEELTAHRGMEALVASPRMNRV